MRVLLLANDPAELTPSPEFALVDADQIDNIGAPFDIETLLARLDRNRIQAETYALNGPFNLGELRRVGQFIRAHDIELVHAFGGKAGLYAALIGLSRAGKVPTLVSQYEHEYLLMADSLPDWLRKLPIQFRRFVRRRALQYGIRCIITPSEFVKRDLIRALNPRNEIQVIYPGIDLSAVDMTKSLDRAELGLKDGVPLVTMIAPMEADEGYDIMLKMLPKLRVRTENVQIVAVGHGTRLKELIQQHPALPVRWLPTVPDLRALIAASSVIILHPTHERLPRVLIEAAAASKPVVASRVTGITEIVEEGVTGLLVTAGDATDFAVQIGRLLVQPAFARRLGTAARKRVEKHFTRDVEIEQLTTLYESTIYSSR